MYHRDTYEININRRDFLVAFGLALGSFGCSGTPNLESRTAEANIIAERQQRLNDLVQKYGSRTVEQILYDHDGSLIRKVPIEYASELVSESVLTDVKNTISKLEGMSQQDKDRFIAALNSPEGKAQVEEEARKRAEALMESYILIGQGFTPFNTKDFAKGKKSKIYMPNVAFSSRIVQMGDKTRITYSPDVALNVRVRHEIFHTEGVFDGWDFDGFFVGSSNFSSLGRQTRDFGNEFYAHFNTYRFFRGQNATDETVVAVDYFKNAVGSMFRETIIPLAKSGDLNNFEHSLIHFLSEKWNNLLPELAPNN